MPPQDNNPDELETHVPEEPEEDGGFTRAFGGKADTHNLDEPLAGNDASPQPGSLTQLLGGKSKPSPIPGDSPVPSPAITQNPAAATPAHSFTNAFDGVNAFIRHPAQIGGDRLNTEVVRQPSSDLTPSAAPGSFTRLFGSGEGVLTPTGSEDDKSEPLRRPIAPKPPNVSPSFPQTAAGPSASDPGSFTEAFHAQTRPEPGEPKSRGGSFTEEFESPSSWPQEQTHSPRQPASASTHRDEPHPLSNSPRPASPIGGFTRLIDPLNLDAPFADTTKPSISADRPPQRPLPDINHTVRGPAPAHDATIAFNPSRSEPEFVAPTGKSEYTMVIERSQYRQPSDPYAAGSQALPSAAAPATPPVQVQYPPVPQAPAWPPVAAPAPPTWSPQPLTPPPVPQPPVFGAPGLPQRPPTAGDKLVSFLPLILALTVVNFLGLLAVLIILFATRK